jgi:hypothetical protein
MKYELFDPQNQCNPFLPLNEISNTLIYYKITGIGYDLDEFDYQEDGQIPEYFIDKIRNLKLGLPLELIYPLAEAFKSKIYFNKNMFSVQVDSKNTFSPILKSSNLRFIDLDVFDQDLKKHIVKRGSFEIKLNESVLEDLKKNSFSTYKKDSTIYKLHKLPSTLTISDENIIEKKLLVYNSEIQLDTKQLDTLKSKGAVSLTYLGNNLNIKLNSTTSSISQFSEPTRSIQNKSNFTPMTIDECKIMASAIYPFREKLSFEVFKIFLGELYSLPVLGAAINEKYGQPSNDKDLKRFLDSIPYEALPPLNSHEKSPKYSGEIIRSGVFVKLWYPFDLKTLLMEVENTRGTSVYKAKKTKDYARKHPKINSSNSISLNAVNRLKLPSYEIGLFSTFYQEWRLRGYSRGALLSSITLAPKEELNIEISSYNKFKNEFTSTTESETERNLEFTSTQKAIIKVSNEVVESSDSKIGGEIGIPIPAGSIPINSKVDGSMENKVTDTLKNEVDNLNEKTIKATEKIKSTSTIKISQTHEFGEERKTTRRIENPNNSRTLIFNHFEILENYAIKTSHDPKKVELCLLIENPYFRNIDLDFVLAYEDRLLPILLSINYQAGFEAAKILAAQRWFENRKRPNVEFEQLNDNKDDDILEPSIVRNAKIMKTVLSKFLDIDLGESASIIADNINPLVQNKPSRSEMTNAEQSFGHLTFWLKFKFVSPSIESKAIEFVDQIDNNLTENEAFAALEKFTMGLDDEWLTNVKMVTLDVVAGIILGALTGPFAAAGMLLTPILNQLLLERNEGLPALIENCKKEVKKYQNLTSATIPVMANDETLPVIPEQVFGLTDLAKAHASFEKLVLHLEANKTYYMNKLWLSEDSDTRFERLRLLNISKFVENQILGFVGNKAAFPLKLSSLPLEYQTYISKKVIDFKLDSAQNSIYSSSIDNLTVPTNAVYMESMLGRCEALEPNLIERLELEKAMVMIQNDMAKEKLETLKLENEQLKKSISSNSPNV